MAAIISFVSISNPSKGVCHRPGLDPSHNYSSPMRDSFAFSRLIKLCNAPSDKSETKKILILRFSSEYFLICLFFSSPLVDVSKTHSSLLTDGWARWPLLFVSVRLVEISSIIKTSLSFHPARGGRVDSCGRPENKNLFAYFYCAYESCLAFLLSCIWKVLGSRGIFLEYLFLKAKAVESKGELKRTNGGHKTHAAILWNLFSAKIGKLLLVDETRPWKPHNWCSCSPDFSFPVSTGSKMSANYICIVFVVGDFQTKEKISAVWRRL